MTLLLPVDGIVRHFSLRDASNGDWAVQGVTLALHPDCSSSPSPGHAEPEECLLLLCGTAGGYLQLHSPQGRLLLRQRLHPGPMRAMQAQPGCLGQAGQAGQAGASVSGVLVGGAVTCTFADAIACVKVSE
ncbi:hypothetical protein HaLaN_12411, partial [Haematococcus lacustris]